MYTHIVFDIDGTIINSDTAWRNATMQAANETLNRKITEDELKSIRGMTDEPAYDYLNDLDQTTYARLIARQTEVYLKECYRNEYYEGIIELFDLLRSHALSLGVVTNRIAFELKEQLWLDICPYFDPVITGEMVRHHKPHAEPMNRFLELANVDRSKVLFVGDTRLDAECAYRSGVDFALATWGTHQPDLTAKYKPTHPLDLVSVCL